MWPWRHHRRDFQDLQQATWLELASVRLHSIRVRARPLLAALVFAVACTPPSSARGGAPPSASRPPNGLVV